MLPAESFRIISVIMTSAPVWELAVTEAEVELSMPTDSILTAGLGGGEGDSVGGVDAREVLGGEVGVTTGVAEAVGAASC